MRIALAQFNPTLGDFDSNVRRAVDVAEKAQEAGATLVVYPAYALCGAPIEGLAASREFVEAARDAVDEFADLTPLPAIISSLAGIEDAAAALEIAQEGLGDEALDDDVEEYASFPEAFYVCDGSTESLGLASWDVDAIAQLDIEGVSVGVSLRLSSGEAPLTTPFEGIDLLVVLAAMPYLSSAIASQGDVRFLETAEQARASSAALVYIGLVGGQASAVFPGTAVVCAADGSLVTRGTLFAEELVVAEIDPTVETSDDSVESPRLVTMSAEDADWHALVLATRDFVSKSGFSDVVIGLSGGIDSSAVAAIAVDALGSSHVHGVLMPGPCSSPGSLDDAYALASNLSISQVTLPITPAFEVFSDTLAEACGGEVDGLARENLQARIRTINLMTLSNTYGWLLLNTGNKSEAAMGFSTLYGDTAGAFAPLGDVYKTRIYELVRRRNEVAQQDVIPETVLLKPPSAELYPEQRDDDRLPAYPALDPLLMAHIERGLDGGDLIAEGFDPALVHQVLQALRLSEYKRRSEPIGPEISGMALTSQRAWPIVNAWDDPCE
jgi:NAD+ synthase (glutamine-hydrolysing)